MRVLNSFLYGATFYSLYSYISHEFQPMTLGG